MTTLVCQTLETSLVQEIRLSKDVRYNIGSIAPYLYVHNVPSGTFTLSIKRAAATVFSQSFTSADIQDALGTAENYMHVFFPIVPASPIQLDRGLYEVVLSATGYTATASSFIAWVQQHENLNNILDYTPSSDEQNPLALRLKVYRNY